MAQVTRKVTGRLAGVFVSGLIWPLTYVPALAQQIKADQIIETLTPNRLPAV